MSADEQRVVDALELLDVWPAQSFTIQQRLGDGPTNQTWRLIQQERSYVLRLVKPQAESLGLSLSSELEVVSNAAQAGLAPRIVASNARHGIVLSEYIEGRVWSVQDLSEGENLRRLANVVRCIHKLDSKAPPLDIVKTLYHYAGLSSKIDANFHLDAALARFEELPQRSPVVCHNDITAPNIIESDKLYLIDWEYSAAGDPLYDLAVTIAHHQLDESLSDAFLFSYLGYRDEQALRDLSGWCELYKNLCVLWESGINRA